MPLTARTVADVIHDGIPPPNAVLPRRSTGRSHRRSAAVKAGSTVPKVATQAAAGEIAAEAPDLAPAIRALVRQVRASSRGRPERGRSADAAWGPLRALADAGLIAQRRAIECAVAACDVAPDDRELFLRWAGVRGVAETFEQLATASARPMAVRTVRLRVARVREGIVGTLSDVVPLVVAAAASSPPPFRTATHRDLTLAEFRAGPRTSEQDRLLRAALGDARTDASSRQANRLGLAIPSDDASERTLDALALVAQDLLGERPPGDRVGRLQELTANGRWRLRRRGWAALVAVQPALLRRPQSTPRPCSPPLRSGSPPHQVLPVEGLAATALMVRPGDDDHEEAIEAVESLVSAGHPLAELAIDLLPSEVFEPRRVGREFALRARRLGLGVLARAGRPDAVLHYDAITALVPAGCDDALAPTIDIAIHQVVAGEANRAAAALGRQLHGLGRRRQPLDPFVAYYLHLWAAEVCERADTPSAGRDAARDGLLSRARALADELHDPGVHAVELARVEALACLRTQGPGPALDVLDNAASLWFGPEAWPARPGLFHTAAVGCRTALLCGDEDQFRRFATELTRLVGPPGRTPALASVATSILDRGERRFAWRP